MKIQFDIKYRDKIESGEYKVVTRDGLPVRIICWDKKDYDCKPLTVVALVELSPKEEVCIMTGKDGVFLGASGDSYDLFIITPEPELTEFEQALKSGTNIYVEQGRRMEDWDAKEDAKELLDLAYRELDKSGYLEERGWVDHDMMNRVNAECYQQGKAEALKDLPRWKKANGKERFNERMIVLAGDNDLWCTNYAEEGEYYLPFHDFEKLPKEDESHE